MTAAFYTDVHVQGAVTAGLRRRGIDVLTAQEDGADETPDPDLLDRATFLDRVLVTQDKDFLAEVTRRFRAGVPFVAVVFAPQRKGSAGVYIGDLELIAKGTFPGELHNMLYRLPL